MCNHAYRLFVPVLSFSLIPIGVCLGQTTELVSVDSLGVKANNSSFLASISADGRYVVFDSRATNLVPSDTNGGYDIFLHDRVTGMTECVSVDLSGAPGNGSSYDPSISPDGRLVAFESGANNLISGDTNTGGDIFVRNLQTGITERVSVDSFGAQGDWTSAAPTLSPDGRYVVFESDSSNLVPNDTNQVKDIFVHDRQTGVTELVSVDSFGVLGNDHSYDSSISEDGDIVVFTSLATNLAPEDSDVWWWNVFVHDRQTGVTKLVGMDPQGNQGDRYSENPTISADGRYVAFESASTNLVPGIDYGVFVLDRLTGSIECISFHSDGTPADWGAGNPTFSADGRYVTFESVANNLVPGDWNGKTDIFVHDRQTGVTERVSVSSSAGQANWRSYDPHISEDGRYVTFMSEATNLVPEDTDRCYDIYVHDRWNGLGSDSIELWAYPSNVSIPNTMEFSWQTSRGNSTYWIVCSRNLGGSVLGGHAFEIGTPVKVLTTGTNPMNGIGSFTSAPTTAALQGHTLYFEIGVQDAAGVVYDSNMKTADFW